jgi:acetyltransferase
MLGDPEAGAHECANRNRSSLSSPFDRRRGRVGAPGVGATVQAEPCAGLRRRDSSLNPKHARSTAARFVRPELPQAPDLAIVCTPPDTVAPLIAAFGELGTSAAIVMTAGLGAARKQAMLDAARPHTLRILGPNCIGLLTPRRGLNASFAHTDALPGKVAFVSQSGALVTAVLDWAKSRRIGFSTMISVGERADVDFGDLLDHFASDAETRSILLYIESLEEPRKFMSAARAAARNKPVIVVKAGRARRLRAAASRTGALAGPTSCSTRRSGAPGCCVSTPCRISSWRPRRWRTSAPTATTR